eukprot:TRINITY_DN33729_c0_g1_i1.p1 TRINITY_DN33729_c0_g1~~TRINITY_DN33729_c0_g1_i1.p1  ORF type:complete len:208 (+),score=105.54 TRINITY_DN33729_c0_g1_i1:44-625(+)
MQGSIEQMYPRTKADYEAYVDCIYKEISKHSLQKKKDGNAVLMLSAVLQQALVEANPDEVKELVKLVDDQCNKKIDAYNKDIGKVKSKLKGIKMFEDGNGPYVDVERDDGPEKSAEEIAKEAEEAEETARRDELAQKELQRKEAERQALQQQMKKEERKVTVPAGFDMSQFTVKKKDDDDFMFGGGKKKGKKK